MTIAGLASFFAPAGATASTTLGQAPPMMGTPAACDSGSEYLQSSVGLGNGYQVPGPGVITAWITNAHPNVMVENGVMVSDSGDVVALRIYRQLLGSNTVTPIAESSTQTLRPSGPNAFVTRLPVSGGELIGIRIASSGSDGFSVCLQSFGPNLNSILLANPAGPLGQQRAMFSGSGLRVDVAAVLEPDADGDGFGDETQDLCPSQPQTQGPCVSSPPPPGGGTNPSSDADAACEKARKKLKAANAKLKKLKRNEASNPSIKKAKKAVKKAKTKVRKEC